MAIFELKNKYNKITSFDFSEDNMIIREMETSNQITEYIFSYSDIDKYEILPERMSATSQLAKITFYSSNKQILKIKNENRTYESVISIIAGDYNILSFYNINDDDNNQDIRKIIYDNSPLRCDLDKQFDLKDDIDKKYDLLTDDTTGWIYLDINKNSNQYNFKINDIPYFTIYPDKIKEKLQNQYKYKEPKCQPYWKNKNTLVFKIPFGEWDISYSFEYISSSDYYRSDTAYAKSIHIIIDEEHPIAKIKSKRTLFGYKLVEKI